LAALQGGRRRNVGFRMRLWVTIVLVEIAALAEMIVVVVVLVVVAIESD